MSSTPKHIAIIMDGNGRWAQRRGHNRVYGHTRGVKKAREVIQHCSKLGVEALTLYTFSSENWGRPAREVQFLMNLLLRYLRRNSHELIENNVRFQAIGDLAELPKSIQEEIAKVSHACAANTGMWVNVALSYGSRQEITSAARSLARDVLEGKLKLEEVSEAALSARLYTKNLPDPDLVIRTGGDFRVSNFLLWQSAYSEYYFTERCWPDFTEEDLGAALGAFQSRERRFGKVNEFRA